MSGFQETFITPLTSIRASTEQVDPLGTLRFEQNKLYKYVMLKLAPDGDVDAAAYEQLIYTDYSAHEVGTDITDIEATNFMAGVTVAAIDMSADKGKYIWMQIKGHVANLGTDVGSGTNGKNFMGGTADVTPLLSVILRQAAGTMINATGDDEVLLDCPY